LYHGVGADLGGSGLDRCIVGEVGGIEGNYVLVGAEADDHLMAESRSTNSDRQRYRFFLGNAERGWRCEGRRQAVEDDLVGAMTDGDGIAGAGMDRSGA